MPGCDHRHLQGILFATTAVATVAMSGVAWAQVRTFDLPSQPAETGISAFARQADVQILVSAVDARGRRTNAVRGRFSVPQALVALLAGSGLSAQQTGPSTWTVVRSSATAGGAADDPPPATRAPTEVTEVLVTASKRPVDILKLPQAVTAITDAQLQTLNAQSFADYYRTVPGLMMNSTRPGALDFSLRGVSNFSANSIATAKTSTVGQYIDEIPVTAVGQQIDARLVDIDRIEVLRGPQGTLFGEDSLGGTIRVITKKPDVTRYSASFEGRLASVAQGGTNDSESGSVNLPLVEGALALRANLFHARDAGYIDSVESHCGPGPAGCVYGAVKDRDINAQTARGGRLMALFKPSAGVSILAEAIHSDVRALDSDYYEPSVGDLRIPDPDVARAVFRDRNNLYNLTTNIDLGWGTLTSASSWGRRANDQMTPQSNPDGSVTETGNTYQSRNFAQEIRLASSAAGDRRWDYLVGAYFDRQEEATQGYGDPRGGGRVEQKARQVAVFGELGYRLTDRLDVHAGLRQQSIRYKTLYGEGGIPPIDGKDTPTTGRIIANYRIGPAGILYSSYSKGFRRGGLNSTVYNSYVGAQNPAIPVTYRPDTTSNYELGWKAAFPWRRARLTAAVYHIDWQNIQIAGLAAVPGGPPGAVVQYSRNAGDAKVDGFELEGGLEPFAGLRVQGSFGLTDSRLSGDEPLPADTATSFALAYCQRGCPGRAGDPIPFVAKVTASLTLDYRHPIGPAGLVGFAIVSEQYQGPRNTDFAAIWKGPSQTPAPGFCGPGRPCQMPRTQNGQANPFFTRMSASSLTNVQLGLEGREWRAALYATNLFDERTDTLSTPVGGPSGGDQRLVGRPRTVGVFLQRSF
jgi:outer membrane receptor protein involved in Fe transport